MFRSSSVVFFWWSCNSRFFCFSRDIQIYCSSYIFWSARCSYSRFSTLSANLSTSNCIRVETLLICSLHASIRSSLVWEVMKSLRVSKLYSFKPLIDWTWVSLRVVLVTIIPMALFTSDWDVLFWMMGLEVVLQGVLGGRNTLSILLSMVMESWE